MNKLYFIIIGLISAIAIFIGGIFTGKYKFSTTDIKIEDRIVYETKWKTKIQEKIVYKNREPEFNQDNFNIFYDSYKAPIQFKDRTEKNYLFVTAYTPYKEATARYEIGSKGNWKVYLIPPIIILSAYGGYKLYKELK